MNTKTRPLGLLRAIPTVLVTALLLMAAMPGQAGDRLGSTCQDLDYASADTLSMLGGPCQADGGEPGDAEDRCWAATRSLELDQGFIKGRLVPPEDNVDVYLLHVPDPAPDRIHVSLFEPSTLAEAGFPDLRVSIWRPCDTFQGGARAYAGSAELFIDDPAPGTYAVAVSLQYDSRWGPQSFDVRQDVYFSGVCKPSCRDDAQEQTQTTEEALWAVATDPGDPYHVPRQILTILLGDLRAVMAVQFADPVSYYLAAEGLADA